MFPQHRLPEVALVSKAMNICMVLDKCCDCFPEGLCLFIISPEMFVLYHD